MEQKFYRKDLGSLTINERYRRYYERHPKNTQLFVVIYGKDGGQTNDKGIGGIWHTEN